MLIFQELVLKKILDKKEPKSTGKGEIKLIFASVYIVLFGVVGLSIYAYDATDDSLTNDILNYFACESSGRSSGDCSLDITSPEAFRYLYTVLFIMLECVPLMIILFTCKPRRKNKTKN